MKTSARQVVRIDPKACIGCTKCIDACPVDAIVGAPQHLHGVLTDACIGCDLCIPPCPVHCIHPVPLPVSTTAVSNAKKRHQDKKHRTENEQLAKKLADQAAQQQFASLFARSIEQSKKKPKVFWVNHDESDPDF